MANFSRFYDGQLSTLATVVAFDPGETTGFCMMGIRKEFLEPDDSLGMKLHEAVQHIEYGDVDCITGNGTGFEAQLHNHAGIALSQEAIGVDEMVDLFDRVPNAAIVLEDFIIDMNQITQARHALSPVRITAMFSYALRAGGFNCPMFIQNRSLAKTTVTDVRLSRWGLYDTHGSRHSRDATRIAYYFLRTCRGTSAKAREKRWRAWPYLFDDPAARTEERKRKALEIKTGVRRPKGERVYLK